MTLPLSAPSAPPAAGIDGAPPAPEARRGWRRAAGWGALALALAAAGAGLWYGWQLRRAAALAPAYATAPLRRGDVTLSVTANGTLQPTRAVNIGSELSGTVARVLVDINDRVRRGQLLAELDVAKLNDQIVRSRAALAGAGAVQAQAQATLAEAGATLARLEQVARLSGGQVPARAELDAARAAQARAAASVRSAAAGQLGAQATLATDSTNLARAAIRAPIDGVVLSRSVDPGNAVAASLQAVTLFTLAEDLHRLRLLVNVDEADVGAVREGQAASFSVSAYAERSYPASIRRVSYGSTISENVVSYVAELAVDNADLSLRPGMSATAVIRAVQHTQVLLVPNSALRFTPASAARGAPAGQGGIVASLLPRLPARAPRQAGLGALGPGRHPLWVLDGAVPRQLSVTLGISDGRYTEVSGAGLREGLAVITDQRAVAR
ncbi:efflux RND transporter periplasmic adaptor subunit [Oxalobacteraceae bacterium]|nr:efflux RND transporter periplasmic adaptor subunit [Oxalobacteraceae bacterium]